MGSDHGAFWVTKDDGHKWTEFSKGLPDAYIRSVSPSVFNKERVYIAMTGLNYDDLNAYLFVSEDYGKSWKSIKSNLPNEPMNKIVEDQTNENIIYAGGYRGVYVSLDRGNSWEYLGKGMPAASISDIEFHDPSQEIVVSTHGRGVYYLDIAPIRHRAQIVEQLQLHIYQPKELKAPSRSIPGGGIDPREIEKLPITFNLPDKGNYTLSILIDDETIWSVSDLGSKGLNQIRWNMVVGTEESDQPYFIHYTNYAQAGEYKLVLEFEGNSEEVNFKLTE